MRIRSRDTSRPALRRILDRFGKLPAKIDNLLGVVTQKHACCEAGGEKRDAGPTGMGLTSHGNVNCNPVGLARSLSRKAELALPQPDYRLVISWDRDMATRLNLARNPPRVGPDRSAGERGVGAAAKMAGRAGGDQAGFSRWHHIHCGGLADGFGGPELPCQSPRSFGLIIRGRHQYPTKFSLASIFVTAYSCLDSGHGQGPIDNGDPTCRLNLHHGDAGRFRVAGARWLTFPASVPWCRASSARP